MKVMACVPLIVLSSGAVSTAYAADPTTADCLAASEASIKLRGDHELRAARAQLLTCASASCPSDVRVECGRRVEAVNAAIPTVVFEAKDDAGNDVSAVRVSMDGQAVAERLEGTAISFDPGEHDFVFEAAGRPPLQRVLVLHEGEKNRHEKIVLGAAHPEASGAPATPGPAATVPPAPLDRPASPGETHGIGTQRVIGLSVGGAGLVGAGLGIYFLAHAASLAGQRNQLCPNLNDCGVQAAFDDDHSARLDQQYGFVSLGVGVAALGVATWLILTSGGSGDRASARWSVSPVVAREGGGLWIGRGW